MEMIYHTLPCFLLSIFFRIRTSIEVLTKGRVAKNMNPAKVIRVIFVENPRFEKNMPDKNNEIDNIFTCLFLLPNNPINKLPLSMPDAEID